MHSIDEYISFLDRLQKDIEYFMRDSTLNINQFEFLSKLAYILSEREG